MAQRPRPAVAGPEAADARPREVGKPALQRMLAVSRIARKGLVPALAGEDHLQRLPGLLGQQRGGQHREVAHQFIGRPDGVGYAREQFFRRDLERPVECAEPARNGLRRVQLVAIAFDRIADREALDGLVVHPRQHGAQQAGVDPAGKEQSERHVGPHVLAHDLLEERGKRLLRLRHRHRLGPHVVYRPVAVAAAVQVVVDRDRMAGRHPGDPGKNGLLAGQELVLEELPDRVGVECRRRRQQWQQGLELGAERDPGGIAKQVQRLDAQPISREHDAPIDAIVDRQRKHAVESPQAVDALGRVDLQHAFRIRVGQRLDAGPGAELVAQFDVVVDLAVDHGRQLMPRRDDRLMATCQVDDRQARVHEPDGTVQCDPEVIGAAMSQRRGGRLETDAQGCR